MGVRIIWDVEQNVAAFYCSVSDFAFGPTFSDRDEAQDFRDWLSEDPRHLKDDELDAKRAEFLTEREAAETE